MPDHQTQEPTDFSDILRAVHTGNLTAIKTFYASHPTNHWTKIRYKIAGDTILHVSARLGHVDIVKYLLDKYEPCLVDCKTADHKTALHEAAQFAKWECGGVLVQYGADVNALKKADWTPLMLACTKTTVCEEDSYKTVEVLASNGALVNYKNKDGWTAAHLLARQGNLDIFNLLRNKYGLDITTKTNNGRTILHTAALHGHLHFLEKSNIVKGLHLNTPDQCGNTAIHEACLGGHCSVVKLLITYKSDYIGVNDAGFNCLHLAAGAGHCDVVKLLVHDFEFEVNDQTKNGGLTALHLAARKKFHNVYDLLLQLGASEEIKDSMERTALDYLQMKT